jgi:hypothetical protein
LRKTNRELQRQNRELQARVQAAPPETKPVVIGNKPKLEDHDYDADKYEEALTSWFERKRQADEVNAKQEAEVMNQQKGMASQVGWLRQGESRAKSQRTLKMLKKLLNKSFLSPSKAFCCKVQITLHWLFTHLVRTLQRLKSWLKSKTP